MSRLLDQMSIRDTRTDNGCLTNSTTLNDCLDYFAIVGTQDVWLDYFDCAYKENPIVALRILFWSRNCRGGAGRRKHFQNVMSYLQETRPDVFSKLVDLIPEYGYWKDVFTLHITEEVLELIKTNLLADNQSSLCAKYMPRKGAWFNALRTYMGLTPKELRKLLVERTKVVEQQMCAKQWSEIEYAHVPSKAGMMYSNAFRRHDGERYSKFIDDVNNGVAKVNASVLYPHELFRAYEMRSIRTDAIKAFWDNLPNYMTNTNKRILPVCDTSGSMYSNGRMPLYVSVGLGCYISERNKGIFENQFITFSENPIVQRLQGDIIDRFEMLKAAKWGYNTDLYKVFERILTIATENNLSPNEMPTTILIISDMQFDMGVKINKTMYENVKELYHESGYDLPEIIFWNVVGDKNNYPATKYDYKVGLVSGYSPSILKSILKGEVISPIELMLETVNDRCYDIVEERVANLFN